MSGPRPCLIVGRPNVGKTLFLINFAEYCGVRSLELGVWEPGGSERTERLSLDEARARLVGALPNQTRRLQWLDLSLPKGKGRRRFRLTDTAGVTDTIHEAAEVRQAVADTLAALRQAAVVLHVVDAAALGQRGAVDSRDEVDLQLAHYASLRAPYAMLANKVDLPWAAGGVDLLRRTLPGQRILPVSALNRRGFAEVRRFVMDHL